MSAALGWMLLVAAGFVLVPVAVLLVQVVCAVLPRRSAPPPQAGRPPLAVLVPAHDESAGIERTLRSVQPQLGAMDRLLVVADNCSDDTAQVAAAAGAEVVERHDMRLRGKGYALDFGIRHLERNPPELVVILDADCEVAAGAIDRIARLSVSTGRPVQALYLMKPPKPSPTMAAIAEFAQVVKNLARPLGYLRLGLPCQLMGTGMALPWELIRSMRLASGHLVEDMKLGIDCARAGKPPLFCPEALVFSYFPVSREGARSQRTRWEHGHLAMIFEAPRLFLESFLGRGSRMLALVVDMCVPPLALLSLAVLALCSLAAIFYVAVGNVLPLQIALLALSGLLLATLLAWMGFGRRILSLGTLACAPFYVAGKLPLYLRFLLRRQVEWVRSKRDES